MALGKKNSRLKSKIAVSATDGGFDFGIVRFTRRKRIMIDSSINLTTEAPSSMTADGGDKSLLETLPQEILIGLLSGVEHDDLKQLILVSKTISEATLIAKEWHFGYSTPSKVRAFRAAIEVENCSYLDEVEAPNAPLANRRFRSLNREKLAAISVALFAEEKVSTETEI